MGIHYTGAKHKTWEEKGCLFSRSMGKGLQGASGWPHTHSHEVSRLAHTDDGTYTRKERKKERKRERRKALFRPGKNQLRHWWGLKGIWMGGM